MIKKNEELNNLKKYQTGNWRYYLAPKEIIKIDQLPEKLGLVERNNSLFNYETRRN